MNRQRAKELLPVIQAFADGAQIQYKTQRSDIWTDIHTADFSQPGQYRVKPQEMWICEFTDGSYTSYIHTSEAHARNGINGSIKTLKRAVQVQIKEDV